MTQQNKCPTCGSTKTKVEYQNETILLVCECCSTVKGKSWF